MGDTLAAKVLVNNLHIFAAADCNPPGFFGIPTWYSYLHLQYSGVTHACEVVNFQVPQSFLLILLALIDIGLHIAGLVAVGFVIYGGIQFVTSRGEPDAAAKARWTVVNALVGLALALAAVGIVAFLGNRLG